MTEGGRARFLLHVAYKPADTDWLGFHTWPVAGEGAAWHRFVPHASVRQLTVLGFPEPGDPYWTPETLAGVGARYPALDLGPWARAAAGDVLNPRCRWPTPSPDGPWWRTGSLYQVYPRSFADADGDGAGDLRGIIAHLDHLDWLGVDGIWLGPVHPSPQRRLGLRRRRLPGRGSRARDPRGPRPADRRGCAAGIRVLIDLVPNHTSDRHPWFVDSRSSTASRHRNWYVWADPGPDGAPPQQLGLELRWPGLDPRRGHRRSTTCTTTWSSSPTSTGGRRRSARAFDGIITFWLDRGVAGFRIDVCNGIVKDALLRDNPPAEDTDPLDVRSSVSGPCTTATDPRCHEVLRRWRPLADRYPDRVLIGETPVPTADGARRLLRRRARRAPPGLQLPVPSAPLEAGPFVPSSRPPRRRCRPAPGRCGPAPTTTWVGWPPGGPGDGPSGSGWPWWSCSACAARRCSTRATRSGCATPTYPTTGCATRWAWRTGRPTPAGTARGRRCRGGTGREPGSPRPGVEPWLPLGDLGPARRGGPAARPGLGAAPGASTCRPPAPGARSATGGYRPCRRADGTWAWRRGERSPVLAALGDERGRTGRRVRHGGGGDGPDGGRGNGSSTASGWDGMGGRGGSRPGRRVAGAAARSVRAPGCATTQSSPAGQVAEVVRALPGVGEVPERGGEDPPRALR